MSQDFQIYEFEEETRKDTEVVIFQCLKGCWHVNPANPIGGVKLLTDTLKKYKVPLSTMTADSLEPEQLQDLLNDFNEQGIVYQRLTMKDTQLARDVMAATRAFDEGIQAIQDAWDAEWLHRGL